ncbi:signal peptidase I [uncultured Salinicola sp.]|uniref:signal peptidase I n=1 Tax=uncultured Salinicola sp. TaxID=1193542 RepID=UPI00261A0BBF|nr:signal peptidase I [uncultured Salinicola sp.]
MATLASESVTSSGPAGLGSRIALLARVVFFATLAAWLFRSVFFAPYYVPSSSMMPSLRQGDFFIASRWDYGISPRSFSSMAPWSPRLFADIPARGDVVVFSPRSNPDVNFVKRVIGLPGDRIAVEDGVISINGRKVSHRRIADFVAPLDSDIDCVVVPSVVDQRALTVTGEEGCRFLREVETLPGGTSFPVLDIAPARSDFIDEFTVPDGKVALFGDNRDDSLDSRYPVSAGGIGMVGTDRILGKLRFVVGRDAEGARFMGTRAFAAD